MRTLSVKSQFITQEILIFFYGLFLFSSCSPLPSGPPPSSNCKFIITGFPSVPNVPTDCFKTASSTDYIDFDVNLIVWYPTNNRKDKLDEKTVSSPVSTTKFPVEINALIPNNGTPYEVEVNVVGRDCSRCASGHSDPAEATGACFEVIVANGYRVAKPRWIGGRNSNVYVSEYVLTQSNFRRIMNVPNSCGCIVPF